MPESSPAGGFGKILRWQLNGQRKKWPKRVENKFYPAPAQRRNGGDIAVTMIGHATVLIQLCGLNILTDPFFSPRTSPVQFAGPKRVREPGIALEKLPPIDFILLSHNHYDHLDLASLAALHGRFEPVIITPLGNGAIIRKTGCAHQVIEADWHDTIKLTDQVSVTLTPARHWSKRTLKDRNMALWSAFVLQSRFGPVYFAGDTGYGDGAHFRSVYEDYGPPSVALLPIGAYEPRWFMKPQHMNPDDAVRAHLDLRAKNSVAIHHGTVQLTDEAIDQPHVDLARALGAHSVDPDRFVVLDCGQSKAFL